MLIRTPSIGDTIAGRYELRDLLRECASRKVYRAFDSDVEAEVALWWMRESLFSDEEQRAAFVERANDLKALKHPHLIRVFQAGRHVLDSSAASGVFVALQLGTSAELERCLHSGNAAEAGNFLRYAEGLVAAVQGAHAEHQVHGYLTPGDIVEVAGQVKLGGVGLFSFLQPTKAVALWDDEARYLAPELAEGQSASASSDWYSVARVLLELAIGSAALDLEDALAELRDQGGRRDDALRPALHPDPGLRATGSEFIAALRQAWQDPLADVGEHTQSDLPTVIDDQRRVQAGTPFDGAATLSESDARDVGAISFLDDEEDKTEMRESDTLQKQEAPFDETATIVESSPELKLEMISRKPATPLGQKAIRRSNEEKSPPRPILRPLSSLAPQPAPAQDLGTLAPPKRDSSDRRYYLLLALAALVLGALSAGLFLGPHPLKFLRQIPRAEIGTKRQNRRFSRTLETRRRCPPGALASGAPSD